MRLSAATGGTICSNEPRVCDGTYADVRDDLYPRLSLCAEPGPARCTGMRAEVPTSIPILAGTCRART